MIEYPAREDKPRPDNGRRRSRKPWFTDSQFQMVVTAAVGVILGLGQLLSNYLSYQSSVNINKASVEIKKELNINHDGLGSKLDNIEKTGELSHAIINSGSVAQDKVVAVTTKSLAVITKDPADILAAEIAEDQYQKNAEQQKEIDAKAYPQKETQP